MSSVVNLEGESNGEPKQCAPAVTCGAQADTVACRKVGSSNLSDRVIKRFGNSREIKSTDPSNIAGFTAQDGESTKSQMGKGSEWIAANRGSEDNGPGSCETHHVSSSAEEDRGVSTCKVGEVEGTAEEGSLEEAHGATYAKLSQRFCLWGDRVV